MPRFLRAALPVTLVAAFAWTPAGAAGERTAAVSAPKPSPVLADAPIVIDGKLDERTWEQAPIIREFIQREPAEGLAPSHATEARVAFDANALYVAIRAFDAGNEALSRGAAFADVSFDNIRRALAHLRNAPASDGESARQRVGQAIADLGSRPPATGASEDRP